MAVGSWTPEGDDAPATIDQDLLNRAVKLSQADELDTLGETLSKTEQSQLQTLVFLSESDWRETLQACSESHLRHLIRFFVCTESAIPGCEAGDRSPAIWANRELKRRGTQLDREMLLWIRANTRNRFIPHGSL